MGSDLDEFGRRIANYLFFIKCPSDSLKSTAEFQKFLLAPNKHIYFFTEFFINNHCCKSIMSGRFWFDFSNIKDNLEQHLAVFELANKRFYEWDGTDKFLLNPEQGFKDQPTYMLFNELLQYLVFDTEKFAFATKDFGTAVAKYLGIVLNNKKLYDELVTQIPFLATAIKNNKECLSIIANGEFAFRFDKVRVLSGSDNTWYKYYSVRKALMLLLQWNGENVAEKVIFDFDIKPLYVLFNWMLSFLIAQKHFNIGFDQLAKLGELHKFNRSNQEIQALIIFLQQWPKSMPLLGVYDYRDQKLKKSGKNKYCHTVFIKSAASKKYELVTFCFKQSLFLLAANNPVKGKISYVSLRSRSESNKVFKHEGKTVVVKCDYQIDITKQDLTIGPSNLLVKIIGSFLYFNNKDELEKFFAETFYPEVMRELKYHHLFLRDQPLVNFRTKTVDGLVRLYAYVFMRNFGEYTLATFPQDQLGSLEQRLELAISLVKQVKDMHYPNNSKKSYLHRDIKPGNCVILIDENTKKLSIYLIDFDICIEDDGKDQVLEGTRRFFAPEVVTEKVMTKKHDVYCTGIVLAVIFGGKLEEFLKVDSKDQFKPSSVDYDALVDNLDRFSPRKEKAYAHSRVLQILLALNSLLKDMTDQNHENRPDIKDVYDRLCKLRD